jgi:hypothetical protein
MKLKMWFFFLRTKNAFRGLYYLNAIFRLRKSFAYIFLKIFVLILAALWLQFLVLPHSGFINTPQLLEINDAKISSKGLMINVKNSNIRITDFSLLTIYLQQTNFYVDNKVYSNDILVSISGKTDSAAIMIYYENGCDIILNAWSRVMNYKDIYSIKSVWESTITGIENTQIRSSDRIGVEFIDCEVKVYIDDHEFKDGPIAENINRFDAYEFLYFGINQPHSMLISCCPQEYDDEYTYEFSGVQALTCNATGNISFSDTPDIKEFELFDKQLTYSSDPDRSRVSLIRGSEMYQMDTSACVTDVYIAGYNLFPSFRNWYYSNLYIAPLTLLSVVISSVAIIFTKRNKS